MRGDENSFLFVTKHSFFSSFAALAFSLLATLHCPLTFSGRTQALSRPIAFNRPMISSIECLLCAHASDTLSVHAEINDRIFNNTCSALVQPSNVFYIIAVSLSLSRIDIDSFIVYFGNCICTGSFFFVFLLLISVVDELQSKQSASIDWHD